MKRDKSIRKGKRAAIKYEKPRLLKYKNLNAWVHSANAFVPGSTV